MVEDNAGDVALIRQSLKEHGVGLGVVVRTDGEKAVRFIEEIDAGAAQCPALVILDLNLPKMTGREVLRRIRQSRSCANVPVAIFSSSDAAQDKQETASLGANRYIKKPSNLDEFLQVGNVLKTLLEN